MTGAASVGAAPVPAEAKSVLVFGGSFDPPTHAHLSLPVEARALLGLDWVLFVPAARSPHKDDGPRASGPDRVAMLAAGLQGAERAAISTLELDRAPGGPSYTVDTLRELRERLGPAVRLRLLIGADQARAFHRWREPREVIRLAEPAVMTRAGVAEAWDQIASDMQDHWSPDELAAWRTRLLAVTPVEGSSTEARALVRRGQWGSERLRRIVPEPVLAEIRSRGLYAPRR